MSAIGSSVWLGNFPSNHSTVFSGAAINSLGLSPEQIIFEAAEAYRAAQVAHNNTLPSGGPYINFATPVTEDPGVALDAEGNLAKSKRISLQAQTIYAPGTSVAPQIGTTII